MKTIKPQTAEEIAGRKRLDEIYIEQQELDQKLRNLMREQTAICKMLHK